jgi:hypothetical protein
MVADLEDLLGVCSDYGLALVCCQVENSQCTY